MIAIVLADLNWGIAKDGKKILHIQKEAQRFAQMTREKTVVLGRKTLEAFPSEEALPGKIHVCISTTLKTNYTKSLIVLNNVFTTKYSISKDVYCIGGASIYRQFYPYFDKIEVTRVLDNLHADLFFPPVDFDTSFERTNWTAKEYDKENGVYYRFETYTRRK